ncbi:hypothetical protein CF328_g5879, partial [Tilletia controversa]
MWGAEVLDEAELAVYLDSDSQGRGLEGASEQVFNGGRGGEWVYISAGFEFIIDAYFDFGRVSARRPIYTTCTSIQTRAIPLALRGKDVLAAAHTGSGKTLAFLIPVLDVLFRKGWGPADGLGALIISPTRELAIQIFTVLRNIGSAHTFSAGLVIGGKDLQTEQERLARINILFTRRVKDLARLSLVEPEYVAVSNAPSDPSDPNLTNAATTATGEDDVTMGASSLPADLSQNYMVVPFPAKLSTPSPSYAPTPSPKPSSSSPPAARSNLPIRLSASSGRASPRRNRGRGYDDEAEVGKDGKVRTKYDRMFGRKNQGVLSEHYAKLVADDAESSASDSGSGSGSYDDSDGEAMAEDGFGHDDENDFLTLKRADHAPSDDDEAGSTFASSVLLQPDGTVSTTSADKLAPARAHLPMAEAHLSKRKLLQGSSKKAMAAAGLRGSGD